MHDALLVSSDLAVEYGQDLKKIQFKDQNWLGLKTRSRKHFFKFQEKLCKYL